MWSPRERVGLLLSGLRHPMRGPRVGVSVRLSMRSGSCMVFVSGPLQRVAQPLRCAYLVTGFVTKEVYVVNNQLTGSESALTVTGC